MELGDVGHGAMEGGRGCEGSAVAVVVRDAVCLVVVLGACVARDVRFAIGSECEWFNRAFKVVFYYSILW